MTQFSQQIIQRVAAFIHLNALLPSPSREPLYVGLSGGPDSVALLHLLTSLGYPCIALHCNFHLRGDESDRDQRYCELLCQSLHVPLLVREFDTRQYMLEQKLSLEMAARQLRYDWWKQLIDAPGDAHPHWIALGHHLDDSIETALMNLMRGTGIHGLTGIVPINHATHVVRPLLALSRSEILDYLHDNQLDYVLDHTNDENDTLRNQIRNRLLPLMQELLPQSRQGIASTLSHLRGDAEMMQSALSAFSHQTTHHQQWGIEWDEISLAQIAALFPTPESQESFILEWTRRHCHPSTQRVIRTAKLLYTTPLDATLLDTHHPTLSIECVPPGASVPPSASVPPGAVIGTLTPPLHELFDLDKGIHLPLHLRRWRQGDRIAPLGMKGHTKLVSDLFSDAHYSPMQKATTWVVTDASDQLLWVVGLRVSDTFRLDPSTQRILSVSILE